MNKNWDAEVQQMVARFLAWRLPQPWNPDNGISYQRPNYAHPPNDSDWPAGTNLFDATQAEAMIRHMLGLPASGGAGGAEKLYDLTVRTQAARIKQLGAAFKGYARHVTSPDLCPAVNFFADERGECTCGLDEWIAAIDSQSDRGAE